MTSPMQQIMVNLKVIYSWLLPVKLYLFCALYVDLISKISIPVIIALATVSLNFSSYIIIKNMYLL